MISAYQPHVRGIILCLAGYFLFSASDAIGKHLVASSYKVMDVMFWGGLISLCLMGIFSKKLGGFSKTFRTRKLSIHLLRGFLSFVNSSLAVYAFGALPMVDAYTLIFLAPFVVALLSFFFFGEELRRVQILCICAGFCGVLVAMRPGFETISMGNWAAIGVALSYSVLFILVKPLGATETRLSLAFYPSLGMTLGALVALGFAPALPHLTDFSFFFLRGITQFVGVLFMSIAFSLTAGPTLAPLHYSQLLWGLLIGFFFFGNVPDIWIISGAAIVVSSGLFLLHSRRQPLPETS